MHGDSFGLCGKMFTVQVCVVMLLIKFILHRRSPMAEFLEFRPVVTKMYLDEAKKLLVTANTENKIEVS